MRLLIALFLVVLGLIPASAETRQHGNVIFDLPPDWSAGILEDGIQTLLYDPEDEVCEYCYAYIGPGAAKSGDLMSYVAQNALMFIDEDDREDAEAVQAPQLTSLGNMPVAMTAYNIGGNMLVVMGYELSDRFELVGFEVDTGYDYDEMEPNFARMQQTIVPMFENLQFLSEGAESLMPDPAPGPLNGMWWGWYQSTGIGLDGMMTLDIDHRRLVFWSNGYFYDGTPPTGLAPLDADALRAAGDTTFGTYRKIGTNVELTFATGETETLRFVNADQLKDDNRDLYRSETAADGTRLNGSVSSFFYSGFTPGTGIEGGVSSSSSTTFYPDGTYTGESFGGAFGNFVDGGGSVTGGFATGGDGSQSGGRYEIKDGVLIQYPSDGSPPSISMVIRTEEGLLLDDQWLEAAE
jgi:hypothetical protein